MDGMSLILFALSWLVIIYVGNCMLAGKVIVPNWSEMSLYITTMAALGLIGEIIFDSVYQAVFNAPLWVYHVLPIHDSYTSIYSVFLWGMIGLHIYLLKDLLKRKKLTSALAFSTIFMVEAIVIETLVNLSFLWLFDDYIYYYLPADLWHLASLQTLPLYLFAGFITYITLRTARRYSRLALMGNFLVIAILVLWR